MPFIWVETIASDETIAAAGINEIKTNIDFVYTGLGRTYPGCGGGAGWTELPVAVDDTIESAQAVQLRERIDDLYDNWCTTYLSGADSGENVGEDTGENVGEDTGVNSGANTSENSGANTGANTGENTGENFGENTSEDVGANVGAETGAQDGDNYMNRGLDWGAAHCVTDRGTYNSGYDATDWGANDAFDFVSVLTVVYEYDGYWCNTVNYDDH